MMKFNYDTTSETPVLYTGQVVVQRILLVLAILSVPWMLLAKPIVLHHRHKVQTTVSCSFLICGYFGSVV